MFNIKISPRERQKIIVRREDLPSLKELVERRHKGKKGAELIELVKRDKANLRLYQEQLEMQDSAMSEHWRNVIPRTHLWLYCHILGYKNTFEVLGWKTAIPPIDEIDFKS